jgi:hypothetical protein
VLSFAERERVCPHLRLVQMPLGKVSCEPGAVRQSVYFPTDSVISQVYVTADGASAQVSSVGNDGALGIALFLSGQSMSGHAIAIIRWTNSYAGGCSWPVRETKVAGARVTMMAAGGVALERWSGRWVVRSGTPCFGGLASLPSEVATYFR